MALTIIGGLLASLIGALLATPCLYKLLDSLAGGRRRCAQGRESA